MAKHQPNSGTVIAATRNAIGIAAPTSPTITCGFSEIAKLGAIIATETASVEVNFSCRFSAMPEG